MAEPRSDDPGASAADPAAAVVDAEEAAANLAALLDRVVADGGPISIEREGEVRAVLVAAADFADLRRLRELERRRAALAELERLNAEWTASGLGYDDEEAERIGKALGKEVNRAVTERFGRQPSRSRRSA